MTTTSKTATNHKGNELNLSIAQAKVVQLARSIVRLDGLDYSDLSARQEKALAALGWRGPALTASTIKGARAAILAKIDDLPAGDGTLAAEAIHASAKEVRTVLATAIAALDKAKPAKVNSDDMTLGPV